MKWQENPKTTPPQEMPQESPSQNNSGNTDAGTEEQVRLLTGQLLNLMHLSASLKMCVEQEQQSSLATPVMEVHLSSALLAMVSLSMSTCDQLRTYLITWKHSPWITRNKEPLWDAVLTAEDFIAEMMVNIDLG